jgi:hypothetical protein
MFRGNVFNIFISIFDMFDNKKKNMKKLSYTVERLVQCAHEVHLFFGCAEVAGSG